MSAEAQASRYRALSDAAVRDRLRHADNRRRAVCEFPLRVAALASDMKQLLDFYETNQMNDDSSICRCLDHMEKRITDEYRAMFGREMVCCGTPQKVDISDD